MKVINSQIRETLKEAGYFVSGMPTNGDLILQNINTGLCELWIPASKNYEGWVIEYEDKIYRFIKTLPNLKYN